MNIALEEQMLVAVRAAMSVDDTAHSLEHVSEVWRIARWLLRHTTADRRIVMAAAFCHDLKSRGEAGFSGAVDSSIRASASVLTELGFTPVERERVGVCIAEASWESFVAGVLPSSQEASILRDADWLEAMGAHGIARVFAFAGRYCLPLSFVDLDPDNPQKLPTAPHTPNPPFDHFYSKLLWLKEHLVTPAAREEGARRHAVMVAFLKDYARETRRTTL